MSKEQDIFIRRFPYYLAIGIIFMSFALDTMFFFVQYPERNHDAIMMIAGVWNTVGFASLISFFYGSTKGSEKKTEAMEAMVKSEPGKPPC